MLCLFIKQDFTSEKRKKKKSRKHKNYDICGKYQLKMEYIVTI